MIRPLRRCFVGALALLSLSTPACLPAQAPPPAPAAGLYSGAQAEAGKAAFERVCMKCHQADLKGKDDAPPLSGAYFASSWGGHKVSELFDFVKGNMPFDQPGMLDEQTYLQVVAYVLSRNGVPAAERPLAPGDTGVIAIPK